MSNINDKIKEISSEPSSEWKERVEYSVENMWLDYSSQIARRILALLKSKDLSQVDLARMVGVEAQQINKIVKGRENLTLKTIYNLSEVLNTELITFPKYEYSKIISKASSTSNESMFINVNVPNTLNLNQFVQTSQNEVKATSVQTNGNNIDKPARLIAA